MGPGDLRLSSTNVWLYNYKLDYEFYFQYAWRCGRRDTLMMRLVCVSWHEFSFSHNCLVVLYDYVIFLLPKS